MNFDFEHCKLSELLKLVRHHSEILGRASEIRFLNDSELSFLSSLSMYEVGIISSFDLRIAAYNYFRK